MINAEGAGSEAVSGRAENAAHSRPMLLSFATGSMFWETKSFSKSPPERYSHSANVVGTQVVFIGGEVRSAKRFKDVYLLDSSTHGNLIQQISQLGMVRELFGVIFFFSLCAVYCRANSAGALREPLDLFLTLGIRNSRVFSWRRISQGEENESLRENSADFVRRRVHRSSVKLTILTWSN